MKKRVRSTQLHLSYTKFGNLNEGVMVYHPLQMVPTPQWQTELQKPSKLNKLNYSILHGNLKCIGLHLNFGIFLFKQTSDSPEMNNDSLNGPPRPEKWGVLHSVHGNF